MTERAGMRQNFPFPGKTLKKSENRRIFAGFVKSIIMENMREVFYQRERETLSQYAMLCENTRGRQWSIEESPVRTEYMRDRDRIVHSKAFRRLKDKTQVFINPVGSHYRTRLTHTLEVAQISRTISRCLLLNEDLTEAIALGHDLGHTPFGHAGERAITTYYRENGHPELKFEHNAQSLRIVEKLENGTGLNLTFEVRDGIYHHRKGMKPATLEGMAVNYADRIAYLNHDMDDALRAGIVKIDDFPKECLSVLGHTHSERINRMITDIVAASGDGILHMSREVEEATAQLRDYMFREVYLDSAAKIEEKKVQEVVNLLFEYYLEHLEELPGQYGRFLEEEGPLACVADYISGMTDRYAVTRFQQIFIPHSWTML